jgi:hypothetical protein
MDEALKQDLYTIDRQVCYSAEWVDQSCCCCHIAYFPPGKFRVCGHWIISLRIPFLAFFGFAVTHASLIYDAPGTLPMFWWVVTIGATSLVWLCIAVSYIMIICKGPGYVPYNWATTQVLSYAWAEEMANMVLYQEQAQLARGSARPPRSSFSVTARRFVLRADHFCVWAQSWIGLSNHRYFLLMMFYALFYML